MPQRLSALIAIPLLLVTLGAEAPSTQPAPVPFDTHAGYFVSNQFEPNAPASFVVIKDQKAFDEVFGAARVMGDRSRRLPANAFDSKLVVAAIKRGKAMWEFTVKEVVADKGVLTIRYTTRETRSDSAEFACPLIVSVPRGQHSAVEFVEDGKLVKKLETQGPKAGSTTSSTPVP